MVQKLRAFEGGCTPLDDGPVLNLIRQKYEGEYLAAGDKPTADNTLLRASDAMGCSRQMGLKALGVPEVLAMEGETLLNFEIGNLFHAKIQDILVEAYGAMVEFPVSYKPEVDVSGSCDGAYSMNGGPAIDTIVEIKTISGYGFKIAVGQRRSDEGVGPKDEHVCQAAIYGNAPTFDGSIKWLHMIYVNKENHTIAEWILAMDEPLKRYGGLSPRLMAQRELQRMKGITGRLDNNMVPARHIPGFGRVEDPPSAGTNDQPWNCRYCRYQPLCVTMETGPVPIAEMYTGEV